MESFICPAGKSNSSTECTTQESLSIRDEAETDRVEHHDEDIITEVGAAGSSSLGRAAQPPPSEKSSTLDAEEAKLLNEAINYPSRQCESASSNAPAPLMVTGIIRRRINLQPPQAHTGTDNATPPPLPPRDPPPVPPRTYAPPLVREPLGPPLPPRNYLEENEEALALPRSTEEQIPARNGTTETSLSQEEQDMQPFFIPNVNLSTTVLFPKAPKHTTASSTSSLRLDAQKRDHGCCNCENMKCIVKHIFSTPCNCCKENKKVIRRHSK